MPFIKYISYYLSNNFRSSKAVLKTQIHSVFKKLRSWPWCHFEYDPTVDL